MSKRPHIRAIGETDEPDAGSRPDESPPPLAEDQIDPVAPDYFEDEPAPRRSGVVLPAIATIAVMAWTVFFVWANLAQLRALSGPQALSQLIASWAVPVMLIGVIWLVAMRNSTRESARFGAVADSLGEQSRQLEIRLASVNRELSLAREFLTNQSRELEFLGRNAVERISAPAEQLDALVRENSDRIDAIAQVSVSALDNMKSLREDLPVVTNAARDASNQIGNAGRAAKNQLAELIGGFERLNEFGQASERQVTSLRGRISDALETFDERIAEIATASEARMAELHDRSEALRDTLDERQTAALAGLRGQIETLQAEIA